MATVGRAQDVLRCPFTRSTSSRSRNESGTKPASALQHQQQLDSTSDADRSRQPGLSTRGESGPQVAWPEEGTDSTSLLLKLLQPRKGPSVTVPPEWDGGIAVDSPSSGRSLTSRVHSGSRYGSGGNDAGLAGAGSRCLRTRPLWTKADAAGELVGHQTDDDDESAVAVGVSAASSAGNIATERRRPAVSLSALSLHTRPEWRRPKSQRMAEPSSPDQQKRSDSSSPEIPSFAAAAASAPAILDPSPLPTLVLPRRALSRMDTGSGVMQRRESNPPGAPLTFATTAGQPWASSIAHGALYGAAATPPYMVRPLTSSLMGAMADGSGGGSAADISLPSGTTEAEVAVVAAPGRAPRRTHGDSTPLQSLGTHDISIGQSSVLAVSSSAKLHGPAAGCYVPEMTRYAATSVGLGAENDDMSSLRVAEGPHLSTHGKLESRVRDVHGPLATKGMQQQQGSSWSSLPPVLQGEAAEEMKAGQRGSCGSGDGDQSGQVQANKPTVPRHPPALRVAIGVLPPPLPSPLRPPSAAAAGPPVTASTPSWSPSSTVAPAAIAEAESPATAAARLMLSTRSQRSLEISPRPPAAPPVPRPIHTQSESPHQLQQPVQSLMGLPSFLGSPVVLEPYATQISSAGPGISGPNLIGPSLSRSTSSADRSLSASTSMAALLAVPPMPSRSPSQAGMGQSHTDSASSPNSFRSRQQQQQHGVTGGFSSSFSRRSVNGRSASGYHRSGSYFRVREAVPEAVLDSLPGVQAARGLPPQPQHPGAVPDDCAPPLRQPPLLGVPAAAAAGLAGCCASSAGGTHTFSSGGPAAGAGRRHGNDSATGVVLGGSGNVGGGGGGGWGGGALTNRSFATSATCRRAISSNSSPQSTLSCSGVYLQYATSGLGTNANWLRREEAMPPPDMLPIQPSLPPLAMDHLQPPSALSVSSHRSSSTSTDATRHKGSDGLGKSGFQIQKLGLNGRRDQDEQLGEGGVLRCPAAYVGGDLVAYDESWADVPAAAAMALMAAASPTSSICSEVVIGAQRGSRDGQSHSILCDDNGRDSVGGADVAVSAPLQPVPSPAVAPLIESVPPQRHTFRSQSKLRLMHLGGQRTSSDGSHNFPAVSEQEALLALLGSSRMLSSVLTATAGPSGASDPAVHGIRDPRYDHSARVGVIPENSMSLLGADGGIVVVGGGSGGGGGIGPFFGNTRMGSTVFSPPVGPMAKLVASFRRMNRGDGGGGRNGGKAGQWPSRSVARAAMLDLGLLSRRTGVNSVVGPDGRSVGLSNGSKGSWAIDMQLELPPPEELVSAVNGHQLSMPQRRFPAGGGGGGSSGGGSGGGSWIWRRGFTSPQADEFSLPVAPSSDESDDRPLRAELPSFKALTAAMAAAMGDGPGLRGSSSGNRLFGGRFSNNGGGGVVASGHHGGVVPALIRHLSAPARRLTLSSNSGVFTGTAASGVTAGSASRSRRQDRALIRKPSFLAAGIRLLKRAFTLGPFPGHTSSRPQISGEVISVASWHAAVGGGDDDDEGCRSPDSAATAPVRSTPDSQQFSRSGLRGFSGGGVSGNSRRRLQASQRSFLKHSAVLGWVQPAAGGNEDGTGVPESEADGDSTSMSQTATTNAIARLHSLQSLMVSGGSQLTCDAVVAFSAGESGASKAGGAAAAAAAATAAARRRQAAARASDNSALPGSAAATSDDASEGARLTSACIENGMLWGAAPGDASYAAWMAAAPATSDNITVHRISIGAEPSNSTRLSIVSPSSRQGDRAPEPVIIAATAAPAPMSPVRSVVSSESATCQASGVWSPVGTQPALLTRIGSKRTSMGRSIKRGSPVVPLMETGRDGVDVDCPYGHRSEEMIDPVSPPGPLRPGGAVTDVKAVAASGAGLGSMILPRML